VNGQVHARRHGSAAPRLCIRFHGLEKDEDPDHYKKDREKPLEESLPSHDPVRCSLLTARNLKRRDRERDGPATAAKMLS